MLTTLEEAVASPDAPDVALVLQEGGLCSVQSRRKLPPAADLSPGVLEDLRKLAKLERDGGLVLFLGAGASAGAGFPTWSGLLGELAAKAELSPEEQQGALSMPAPDAADVIGSALSDGLGQVVAQRFTQDGCALTHALLASLGVDEAVTTNYDTLYENASQVPQTRELYVLPRQCRESDAPRLLKLHGDVRVPESIVLTRGHYLRFDVGSAPLAAVMQSLMADRALVR